MNSASAGTPARQPRLFLIGGLAVVACVYFLFLASTIQVILAMNAPSHARIMTAQHELPQSDFAMFWYSGKLLTINFANAHGYHITLSPWEKHTFQLSMVTPTRAFHLNWMYPPTMGVLAMLYATTPLAVSYWLWRGLFLLISALLLWRAGLGWAVIAMGLASPAELHDLLGGQNGALTGGLLVSSLLMIDRKPLPAGMLGGLLSIKPQMGVVLPLILLRRHRRAALIACTACVAILALITLPLEGLNSWIWFFTGSRRVSSQFMTGAVGHRFSAAEITVFFSARALGASLRLAWVAQIFCSSVAALLIWHRWRTPAADPIPRMALTLCLWILLTPYGYMYDLVGYSIGMAAMFFKATDRQKPLFGVLWLLGGYTGTLANMTGVVLMPLGALVGAVVLWRMSEAAAAPGTSQYVSLECA